MTNTETFILIVGMACVTFLCRYPLLALSGSRTLPKSIIRALNYAPVAVLTAICAPLIFSPNAVLDISPSNPWLIGSIVAIVTSAYSRHLVLTIILSMAVFFSARFYIPLLT